MILMNATIGQLNYQVHASLRIICYIKNYFVVFTFYVAMEIEVTGLIHASYLIHNIFAKLSGNPIIYMEHQVTFDRTYFWGL